jgi:hypothetical protein
MRAVLEHRAPINLAVAGVIGTLGLRAWPFPAENVFLAVLAVRKPWLFDGLAYLYATLWFSTPFIALSLVTALATIAVLRGERAISFRRSRRTPILLGAPSRFSSWASSITPPGPRAYRVRCG